MGHDIIPELRSQINSGVWNDIQDSVEDVLPVRKEPFSWATDLNDFLDVDVNVPGFDDLQRLLDNLSFDIDCQITGENP